MSEKLLQELLVEIRTLRDENAGLRKALEGVASDVGSQREVVEDLTRKLDTVEQGVARSNMMIEKQIRAFTAAMKSIQEGVRTLGNGQNNERGRVDVLIEHIRAMNEDLVFVVQFLIDYTLLHDPDKAINAGRTSSEKMEARKKKDGE